LIYGGALLKKEKAYPFNSKEDFVKGLYLVAEHVLKYFLRYQKILKDFEEHFV
jgi:hypothetical protein